MDEIPPAFQTPPALGINPPESKLPPAPAVGVVAVAAPAPAPAEATAKRGPGRPRKSPGSEAETPPESPSTQGKPIGTLYLDCYPVGSVATQAEALFLVTQANITKSHNVPDYRLIDFKGAGIFAATLGEVVDRHAWGDVVLDTRTPEGAIAKSVLVFRAERVVQGLR
jgi:hypothetical protein